MWERLSILDKLCCNQGNHTNLRFGLYYLLARNESYISYIRQKYTLLKQPGDQATTDTRHHVIYYCGYSVATLPCEIYLQRATLCIYFPKHQWHQEWNTIPKKPFTYPVKNNLQNILLCFYLLFRYWSVGNKIQ